MQPLLCSLKKSSFSHVTISYAIKTQHISVSKTGEMEF